MNVQSIPSVMDGLKPVQRKVLYACFKRNLTSEIKVAQLAGYDFSCIIMFHIVPMLFHVFHVISHASCFNMLSYVWHRHVSSYPTHIIC